MSQPVARDPRATSDIRESALSDDAVIRRVRSGEVDLYEVLMRRHNQRLYRAVRAILHDESEVEDVLQDTYLAAYRSLDSFENRSRFSTWLTRIAVNRALDRRRRRARLVMPSVPVGEEASSDGESGAWGAAPDDPERASARHELADLLQAAIDRLPETFRPVYVMREVEGLSVQETSEILGIEANTVKTRLHRARGLLRQRLRREIGGAAGDVFPFGAGRCDRLVATVLDGLDRDRQGPPARRRTGARRATRT